MKLTWKNALTEGEFPWLDENSLAESVRVSSLADLKRLLDSVHIKYCLIKPFQETANYPVLESRELLPSFEADPWEYHGLPGFSLVAFDRPLNYFQEIFQFDLLYPPPADATPGERKGRGLTKDEMQKASSNMQAVLARLPRAMQESFRAELGKVDVSLLNNYPALLSYLLEMDRAHVFAMDDDARFYLAGLYASFPSDLDSEIKRFGLRLGKFTVGDNDSYIQNRQFVYQYLMELYGFPIASERRTSSALFARSLHKMGERFMVRVMGQSDRTLTTLYNFGEPRQYPHLEKIALVQVDEDQDGALDTIADQGYFLDAKRRVIILRIKYTQHKFNPNNVRQDRALSVTSQEVIHPFTGEVLANLNVVKDTTNLFLRLNDIVRGEYTGRIVYKRYEIVENTDTDEKRLKFLFSWLSKHQRRIISYSDEFYAKVAKVLDNYLLSPEHYEIFESLYDLYQEVLEKFSYIQQARKVRALEDISSRNYKGERVTYRRMLADAVNLLQELRFEIINYFDSLVSTVIVLGESMLNDRYLVRNYIDKPEQELTPAGLEVRKNYGKLVSLVDDFKAVRKMRVIDIEPAGE